MGFRQVLASRALISVILVTSIHAKAVDFETCCTLAPVSAELRPFQWDACYAEYNSSETDPNKRYAPKIPTTLAWCEKNCIATDLFVRKKISTSEWLTPFATWFLPASALLLLFPGSEHLHSDEQQDKRTLAHKLRHRFIYNWLTPLLEYTQILGDPASAFNGAISEIAADWMLCMALKRPFNGYRERSLIVAVVLSSQIDFRLLPSRNAFELVARSAVACEYNKTACRVMLSARKKFNTSVTIPTAMYIGIASAVFYDAYQKLGDNSTSHSLAYGVWYNWMLLLAVFSNTFASHSNLESVRSGLEVIVRGVVENHTLSEFLDTDREKHSIQKEQLENAYILAQRSLLAFRAHYHPPMAISPRALYSGSLEVKAIPLSWRYRNTRSWVRWLYDHGVDVDRPSGWLWRYQILWVDWCGSSHPVIRYVACQVLAWFFVLYSCICAATISYTTPKVTLGCRSLNHLLYAALSLINAIIRVVKDTLEPSDTTVISRPYSAVSFLYHFTVGVNAVVILIGGSILQMVGGFKTCWCMAGLLDRGPNSEILLGKNTQEDQYWAANIWLKVAYAAYGGVAMICVLALMVRVYITQCLRKNLRV